MLPLLLILGISSSCDPAYGGTQLLSGLLPPAALPPQPLCSCCLLRKATASRGPDGGLASLELPARGMLPIGPEKPTLANGPAAKSSPPRPCKSSVTDCSKLPCGTSLHIPCSSATPLGLKGPGLPLPLLATCTSGAEAAGCLGVVQPLDAAATPQQAMAWCHQGKPG